MFLVKIFALTLLVFGVFCDEDEEDLVDDMSLRERREYIPEAWRAMEERMDMSGWVPQETSSESREVPIVKRRRLRKRKRRPPHISMSGESSEQSQDQEVHLIKDTLKLSENGDVWDDMQRENLKQTNRRRTIPSYNPTRTEYREQEKSIEQETDIEPTTPNNSHYSEFEVVDFRAHEKIRDPFDALKEAEEKQKTPEEIKQVTLLPDLRTLLKKTGGSISLSEILQQKNLSLSELLRGNSDAISALTEPPEIILNTDASIENHNTNAFTYHRVPPFERKKMANRVFSQSSESSENSSSQEIIDVQKKRLALFNDHRENNLSFGVTHTMEVVTEPITETRIFVPSQPKYQQTTRRTTYKYTTAEPLKIEKDNAVSSNTIVPPKSIFRNLPITSAKLLARTTVKPSTNTPKIHQSPPKAIKIALKDIFKEKAEQPPKEVSDDPVKISLDLDISPKPVSKTELFLQSQKQNSDKLKIITAREEILQILENPFYKERLSRILQQRNMTVQELVEQRERGSSQLHLADIFHNKTREPEPIEEAYIGVIKSEVNENSRVPKSRIFDENTEKSQELLGYYTKSTNEATSTETVELKMVIPPLPTISEQISNNNFNSNKTLNYAAIMPFWKQFHPTMFKQLYQSDNSKLWNDISPFEETDRGLSDNMNNKFGIDLRPNNYHLDQESFFDVPTGVKSALVASFVIVGLSIFMFLTIFIVFKWTQRKKNQLTYISSLSGAKIRAPILEIPRKNGLKSFMCETLGRKTNFYKSHLQSMTDVWDDRKQKF